MIFEEKAEMLERQIRLSIYPVYVINSQFRALKVLKQFLRVICHIGVVSKEL